MSRLRVKAILDNAPHLLEVDRRSVTFDSLNSEISGKLNIGNAYTLIYQAPTGIQYQISDDASLQRAITESTKAGARSLDLKVLRTGASSVTPSTNVSPVTPTPAPTSPSTESTSRPEPTSPPPQQQQQQQAREVVQSPVSPSSSSFTSPSSTSSVHTPSRSTPTTTPTKTTPTWRSNQRPPEQPLGPNDVLVTEFFLPRNPLSTLDKVKIIPDQTYSHFLFTPEPSRYDTNVRVVIVDRVKLQYQCTYELDKDPSTRQFMLFTQSFQLPFDIDPKTVEVMGNQIKVMIPNRY